eukprot:5912984-Ditylum_brightwellii.AAC.1
MVGYNTAIAAFACAGQWKMAVRLLDEMEGSYMDDTTTSILLLPSHVFKLNSDQVTWHCRGSMWK